MTQLRTYANGTFEMTCADCDGAGMLRGQLCTCGGHGVVLVRKVPNFQIEPGQKAPPKSVQIIRYKAVRNATR